MRSLSWPQAVVIVAFLGAIVALSFTGRDTAALIAVGTALLGGLGVSLGQQQTVKEHVNGNTTKLLNMVEKQSQMLAAMAPAQPPALASDEDQSSTM